MLENVSMKKEWENIITNTLHTQPIEINSNRFSAQNRKRIYWTNIPLHPITQDSQLTIGDILTNDFSQKTVKDTKRNLRHEKQLNQKALCCSATMWKGAGNNGMTLVRRPNQKELSILNPNEVESLQTVPHNYTNHVSNTQRYKMLGNGWTIDVIVHLLKGLTKEETPNQDNILVF